MNFLHSFYPQSIAFSLGPVAIHWYGLFIVTGIFLGLLVVLRLAKYYGIQKDSVYDVAFYTVLFSIVGARLYAVLLFAPYYFANPTEIIAVWRGGLAIHGAIIGGIFGLIFYCYKKKDSFWKWADVLVPALALGQAIGRFGNYFNQELYGGPTDAPWGIPIDLVNRVAGFEAFEFFHPTFLYESILNLTVFLILIYLHVRRIKNINPVTNKPKAGRIALIYLMLYSVVRIIMEQFRIDDTPELLGLRLPVLVSIIIIIVAMGLLFKKRNLAQSP